MSAVPGPRPGEAAGGRTPVSGEIRTVGLAGLGAMGYPMARHLLAGGFTVVGVDPSEAAARAAVSAGVEVVGSPAEMARTSDLIMIVVGTENQMDAILDGDDGILAGGRAGTVVAVASTVSPGYLRALAARLEHHDLDLLDMPLTRGDAAAAAGEMLILAGAEIAVLERCRSALATFASDIFHVGGFGSGQIAKMVNNMILWACMAANDEAFRLGAELGLDEDILRNALTHSSAANFSMTHRLERRPIPWTEKDMTIAQHEADRLRLPIPVAGVVKEAMKAYKVRVDQPTPST